SSFEEPWQLGDLRSPPRFMKRQRPPHFMKRQRLGGRSHRSVLFVLAGKLIVLVEGKIVGSVLAQHVLSFVAAPICLHSIVGIEATAQFSYSLFDRGGGFG